MVFGVLDKHGRLIPRIRNTTLKGDVFNSAGLSQDKEVNLDSIIFAPHLKHLRYDTETLTEYCRVCLKFINQGKPLRTSEAVKQAEEAMAAKRLDETR